MTDQEILHLAFHGDADAWHRLHELSNDRAFAKQFLRLLERHESENRAAGAAWRDYFEEYGLAEP
ncbi:MAG: hypothetical protein IT364_00380 [Candidatus Hydrogenedentes bacterium]|nr:hypothetical protein [Candidatus Hydrogenedentota bacterium]